jgi:hypothetical protein
VAPQAVRPFGMPGRQRAGSARDMTGHALLYGRDLPVGEIAWHGRIIVARAREEGDKNNHGNYQADKNEI